MFHVQLVQFCCIGFFNTLFCSFCDLATCGLYLIKILQNTFNHMKIIQWQDIYLARMHAQRGKVIGRVVVIINKNIAKSGDLMET